MGDMLKLLRTLFSAAFEGFYLELRELPYPKPKFFPSVEACAEAVRPKDKNNHFGVALRTEEKGNEAHAGLLPALFTDIDVEKDFAGDWEFVDQVIKGFGLEPSIIVNSGRGYHLYWLLAKYLEITPKNRNLLRGILAGLAKELGGDPACKDLSRLMRLPGTYNCKDGNGATVTFAKCPNPIYVELIKCDSTIRYQFEDFTKFYFEKSRKENASLARDNSKSESGIPQGSRNQTLTSLAGSLRQAGFSDNTLLGAMEGLNARLCKPSLPTDEVERICNSVMRYPGGSSDPTKDMGSSEVAIPLLSVEELLEKTPDVTYLIEDFAPRGGVILIVADAGVGKTWLCAQAALSVATGEPFLDHFKVLTPGKVLILDEENSRPLNKQRVQRLIKCHNGSIDITDLPIRYSMGTGIDLTDEKWVVGLEKILQEFEPDLVIMDSLVRFHRGDENSSRDMAQLFSNIKQLVTGYGTTFLICHHKRKPGPIGNSGSTAFRGSTEIRAFMDAQFDISTTKVLGRLIVTNTKSRFSEPLEPFEFEINDVGDGTRIDFFSYASPTSKLQTTQEFITELVADGQWHSRQEILEKGNESGFTRDALDKARQALYQKPGYREIKEGKAIGIQKTSDEPIFLGGSEN